MLNPRMLPFIYAFNPKALVAGQSYTGLSVKTDLDARFHLTNIVGANSLSSDGFRFYRRDGSSLFKALLPPNGNIVVAPELVFEPGDQLVFDTGAILNADCRGIVGFQGYREFSRDVAMPPAHKGPYYEVPFSYPLPTASMVTAVTACGNQQITQVQRVQDYDFELRRILIANVPGTGAGIPSDSVLVQLLDPQLNGLSNIPIPASFVATNITVYSAVFPVPPVLYPKGSQIQAYLYNRLGSAEVGCDINCQVIADGVHRVPCDANFTRRAE